jgi:serine protease Do
VALPGDSNGSAVGARVVGIEPDSPADQAGLKVGDVIRQFQGRHMDELRLRGSIAVLPPGTKVAMDIVREGKRVEVSTSLGDRDEYVSRAAAKVGQVFVPRLGITVKTLTRAEARAQGYRSLGGVMVSGVDKNSKGDAIGLQEGDILHQLDRRDIEDADQFARAMADADLSKGAVLGVVRGRMSAQVVVGN